MKLIIVSATCLLAVALVDLSKAIDIKPAQICNESVAKKQSVAFTSVKQVREILEAYEAETPIDCDRFGASFAALKQVIDEQVTSDVCSDLAYARILDFHTRFVSPYTALATRDQLLGPKTGAKGQQIEPIPSSLRNFFILFAQQISGQCERLLVDRLNNAARRIYAKDFETISLMKKEGARILGEGYREQAHKMRSVVLSPKRYYIPAKEGEEEEGDKLYVQVRFNDPLKRVKDICENKLKPVYEELFIPVMRLQAIGYVEQVHNKHEKEQLTWDSSYTRWYPAIEYCELVLDIEVIHDDSSFSAIADIIQDNSLITMAFDDKRKQREVKRKMEMVKFLSREEADELKAQISERVSKYSALENTEVVESIETPHQASSFEPRLWFTELSPQLAEVRKFEKRIGRMIWRKTNRLRLFGKQSYRSFMSKVQQLNVQWRTRDETSKLGKVASWIERHPTQMTIIKITLVAFFLSVHFAG